MSINTIRYPMASAFALAAMFSVTNVPAQSEPPSIDELVGEWKIPGGMIVIRRNGDVWQQSAPTARIARSGDNYVFEGMSPDSKVFHCTYQVTLLDGTAKANFRLVQQRGDNIKCIEGIFERVQH